MKKLFLALAAALMLMACGSSNSPVDKFLDMLDDSLASILSGESISDEMEQEATKLLEDNKDYILTSSDKKRIVKKMEALVNDSARAAMKANNIPSSMEGLVKSQIKEEMKKIEEKVNNIETFAELGDIFN